MPVILAICLALTACAEFNWNPLDPTRDLEDWTQRDGVPAVVLSYSLPTLNDSASFYDFRVDPEAGTLQRRRSWRGPPGNDVSASLIEIRRLDGGAMTAPPRPDEATVFWQRLTVRRIDFRDIYESENAIGPVVWQRFVVGSNLCVMLTQGWAPDGGDPTRHVVGYYCAPSGTELSPGQAETVVRAVRVRDPDPSDGF